MKPVSLLLTTTFVLFFTSCSKKEITPEPEPPKETVIQLWLGEDSLYTPDANMKVKQVKVTDSNVVSAVIVDGRVRLKAVQEGSSPIIFTDVNNQSVQETMWTMVPYQLRNLLNNTIHKPTVKVQATDAATASSITKELDTKIGKLFRLQFRRPGVGIYSGEDVNTPLEVPLRFEDLWLEFTVNEVKRLYKVHTHKDRTILALEQDLTDYYKALYPDKGIQSVITIQYVQHQLPPG